MTLLHISLPPTHKGLHFPPVSLICNASLCFSRSSRSSKEPEKVVTGNQPRRESGGRRGSMCACVYVYEYVVHACVWCGVCMCCLHMCGLHVGMSVYVSGHVCITIVCILSFVCA